jgi:hypothetical protein
VKHGSFGESKIGYPTVIIVFIKEELGNQAVDRGRTQNHSSSTIVLACANRKSCRVAATTVFISTSAPWTLITRLKGGVTSAKATRTSSVSTKESATFFKRKTRIDRNASTFVGSTGADMATAGRTEQDE